MQVRLSPKKAFGLCVIDFRLICHAPAHEVARAASNSSLLHVAVRVDACDWAPFSESRFSLEANPAWSPPPDG